MQALKVEHDIPKAITLFREALAFDASHEDARYYLGHCLAEQGDIDGALRQYEQITRLNPRSHRGHARWGTLRAMTARSAADLAAAEAALDTAYRLNPEETGVLLTLGEVALMRHEPQVAEKRLSLACRTNPRAAGGLFLLGYLRWKRGDPRGATEMLEKTRAALGPEWKPTGATAEGDVARKAHSETTPLSPFLQQWDGTSVPDTAYARLDAYVQKQPR
jgi:cytochrome c-type biogenesis protein CcmH/NrfG